MNEIVNTFLLEGYKFIPEQDVLYIIIKKNQAKPFLARYGYRYLKYLPRTTSSGKALCDEAFNIDKN